MRGQILIVVRLQINWMTMRIKIKDLFVIYFFELIAVNCTNIGLNNTFNVSQDNNCYTTRAGITWLSYVFVLNFMGYFLCFD